MTQASCIPTEYQNLGQEETSFFSSGRAESEPTVFSSATAENGWRLTVYEAAIQQAEDEADIRDSLEALKEPPGISLDELTRELDAR